MKWYYKNDSKSSLHLCWQTLFLFISLTLFDLSDFLQLLPLMSVLTTGLRASATIIVHSCGLSHQSPVRRSALSRYPRQCWGWWAVSQEPPHSLKIFGACSIRSVFFLFPSFFFYFHPLFQMMHIGSAVWTGLTVMTMLLLAQWDVGCWGMTLNSIPLRPASLRPFRASVGAIPSKTQAQLGVEPILRPGGVHGRWPSLCWQGKAKLLWSFICIKCTEVIYYDK